MFRDYGLDEVYSNVKATYSDPVLRENLFKAGLVAGAVTAGVVAMLGAAQAGSDPAIIDELLSP